MKVKYLPKAQHPVTITVIGAGGTGSQLMLQLGRMNHALVKLGHPGFYVLLMDGDVVTSSNVGRQLFTEGEIGEYKANILITRMNRIYGTEWQSDVRHVTEKTALHGNVIITCVDNHKARFAVAKRFNKAASRIMQRTEDKLLYWLDMGNTKTTGQVILGGLTAELPTVVEMYGKMMKNAPKDDDTPSCSMAEALGRQHLFINTFVASVAATLLFEMCRNEEIHWRGAYINLDTLNIKKIKVA